jgi:hypothetical protein
MHRHSSSRPITRIPQRSPRTAIHYDYFVGVWIFVSIRFSQRLVLLDERRDAFLRTLVYLGGYCTVEQAHGLGLADSHTRVVAQLKALEQIGFLRQITHYPVIHQVTMSATRLVGADLMARRRHSSPTIRCKLLGVNFYLESKAWPAEFTFPHSQKIMLLNAAGCPTDALPHVGGRPYLWQEFLLRRGDGILCVAAVDRPDNTPKYQTRTLSERYSRVLEHIPSGFRLIVVVGSEGRARLYRKWAAQSIAGRFTQDTLKPYQVRTPIPQVNISLEEKKQ